MGSRCGSRHCWTAASSRADTALDQTRSDCPQNITAILLWAKDRFSSNPHLFLINLGAYCKAFPCSPLDPLTRDWTWRMLHQHEPTYSIYCMQRSKPEGMVIPSLKKSKSSRQIGVRTVVHISSCSCYPTYSVSIGVFTNKKNVKKYHKIKAWPVVSIHSTKRKGPCKSGINRKAPTEVGLIDVCWCFPLILPPSLFA